VQAIRPPLLRCDLSAQSHPFHSEQPPSVFVIEPNTGSAAGGTAVVLRGVVPNEAALLECAFGTLAPVLGGLATLTELSCVTPAHAVAAVPVAVNRRMMAGDVALGFTYMDASALHSLRVLVNE